jgi:hypothetical protein
MSGNLRKLTVNLYPKAVDALQAASNMTGDNRTDTVNRALQIYAYLMEQTLLEGRRLQSVDSDGTVRAVEFE